MDIWLDVIAKVVFTGYYIWKWLTEYNDRQNKNAPKTTAKKSKKRK